MYRKGFIMQVYADKHAEYKKRHDEIWQELATELLNHGVKTYSIFLDAKTNQLFGYVEVENLERWQDMANTAVCQKWWKFMADVMPSNIDNSPESRDLKEVFYLAK
ncbi:MAG: L-rhamnose mutarotase [Alphaproteobacteria bacterium]|jgi:L-rhamnose mutarotase|nr:L-rhamnose mutarotase [Alphaproteobacteria bacterium]